MALREFTGGAKRTTLASQLASGVLTMQVVDATGYPTGTTGPFALALDQGQAAEEKVLCSTRSGNTITIVTRGYDGTAASTHPAGSTVDHVVTAIDLAESNAHVNAVSGVHGVTGAIVDTTTAQTLTNKTLGSGTVLPATVVDTTTAQTLTNKTLGSGTVFPSTVVDTTSVQTLSNKTLTQAQTHASPDTDLSPTALHHTLGAGANQAAAGNHTHAGTSAVLVGATVATSESTSSASYADLATVGPSVTLTVPASGMVVITLTTRLNANGNNFSRMSFAASGANTIAASDANALILLPSTITQRTSAQVLLTGLTAGSTTFTAKYTNSGNSNSTYADRTITALAV